MDGIFDVFDVVGSEVVEQANDRSAVVTLAEVLVLLHSDHGSSELMDHGSMGAVIERCFPEIVSLSELPTC